MSTINERVRAIASIAGMDRLVRETRIGSNRWRTVLYNKDVRISTDEIDVLGSLYPQYRWWMVSGEVAPEIGQTSPAYDEANRKLHDQSAG
ncbi:hypothetical protein OSS47_12850 [Pseudomonas citronellolis]|jgi:hypothetical protein|nr:hypothetical protein OSS47_12850 [Pseudomonas citronellolis]